MRCWQCVWQCVYGLYCFSCWQTDDVPATLLFFCSLEWNQIRHDMTRGRERVHVRACDRVGMSAQFIFCLPGCWPLVPFFEVNAERERETERETEREREREREGESCGMEENRAASLARSPRLGLAAVALWWMRRGEMRARTKTHKWVLVCAQGNRSLGCKICADWSGPRCSVNRGNQRPLCARACVYTCMCVCVFVWVCLYVYVCV